MLGAFGGLQREDIKFASKPYGLTNHFLTALGQEEYDYSIPFIPGNMASDKRGGSLVSRRLFARDLPNSEAIRQQNAQSIQESVLNLAQGGVVIIYPTGESNDARESRWYKGVGEIIKKVKPENRDDISLVPFYCEGIKPSRILSALLLQAAGINPREQRIFIRLGQQGSIGEVLPKIDTQDSQVVTATLKEQFVQTFS